MQSLLKPISRLLFAGVMIVVFTLPFGATEASDGNSTVINTNTDGVAAKGYDLVSYFDKSGPQKGHHRFSVSYAGASYYFANGDNKRLFKANPEKYLPAYGGFCSYGVVLGKKFDISIDAWKIVDGVLYLQLDKGTRLIWEEEVKKNIEIGNRVWPTIEHISANDL